MSDPKPGEPRRAEETAREELRKERDDFLKAFFRKGVELTEELVRERDSARQRLLTLEEENARLRAQVATGDAIRELLRAVEQLEADKQKVLRELSESQQTRSRQLESYSEVESELASLANLYVASYQLHGSASPRNLLQNIKELLAQFIGAEAFALFLHLGDAPHLVPVISEGVADADLGPVTIGEGPVGEAFVAARTTVRDDDPRTGTLEQPVALVPLRLRDDTVGVLVIFRTLEQKHAFIQADHELLKLLSAQAMTALVAARFLADQGASSPLFASLHALGIT